MASSIEWLNGGETWNPIRARLKNGHPVKAAVPLNKLGWACVRVSPGCEHCYSEKQNMQCGTNKTRAGTGLNYTVPALQMVDLFLDEKTLMQPLHWKKPRLIFPCSMTDWMADFVPDEWRDRMLAVMASTPQHTYLTLTKRADIQRKFLSRYRVGDSKLGWWTLDGEDPKSYGGKADRLFNNWPLPNLWLGTSAENQKYADIRIPELLQTPATVRWVSIEPLLEGIDFYAIAMADGDSFDDGTLSWGGGDDGERLPGLDWVVVGGESGPGARPFNIEWARQIVAQCTAARVPVFVKQLGSKPYLHKAESVHIEKPGLRFSLQSLEINSSISLKNRKGGDISEWPKDLRVREYPRVAHASS